MSSNTTLFSLLAIASLGVSGCAGDGDAAATTRDSAGIRIVESPEPRWHGDDAWRVGRPEVTIGAAEGEPGHQLERPVAATRSSDGTIIVADAGASGLLRYDSLGRFLGAAGRAGEGPGEFRALSWAGRAGSDSIVAWDRGLNRVTVFAADGSFARDFRPALSELPMSLEVKGMLSGGRLLLARGASFIPAGGDQGVQRQPITAWMLSPTGQELRSFGPFPGEAVELRAGATPNSTIRTPIPFGASTLFAAAGSAVYVVDTDEFAARVYSDAGPLSRIVRRRHERLPVRPEDVAAFIEEKLEGVPPIPTIREGSRRSLEAVPPAGLIPAVRSVRVDVDGHLWLEAGRRPADSEAVWSVFDPDGEWLGDVRLPASLTVLEIGRDYILASDRDALDVPRVHLLPLSRGGS